MVDLGEPGVGDRAAGRGQTPGLGDLASLVAERDLPRANALVGLAEQVARLAGSVLGGLAESPGR